MEEGCGSKQVEVEVGAGSKKVVGEGHGFP